MTQIMIGIGLALLLALGVQSYRASSNAEAAAVARAEVAALQEAVRRQTRQAELQENRFTLFDKALADLGAQQQQAFGALSGQLESLENFKPQPEDSDETVRCARLPVPGAVDQLLR